jgi:ubiquinone/menaquinone biosynthesis C-methylase UbiE
VRKVRTLTAGATVGFWACAVSVSAGAADPDRDQYQNPRDTAAYVAAQEDPARDAWQKPEQILDALSLQRGQTVCDIGAGPGYFTLRAARRVGEGGHVFAVDVDPRILDALRERIDRAKLDNITPVLGLGRDPLLPPGACDLILVIDVYHHFPDRPAYLRRLVRALHPGGRLAAVDWYKRATPIGPPQEHRVSREEFLASAARAGLRIAAEPTFLVNQYFVIMERAPGHPPVH